jgi:small subunit ribosomal protein S1
LVSLSKGIEHESWENAERYLQNGFPLELQIIGHNRGGLIIEYETLRGFLPYSQVPGLRGIKSPRLADKIKREMVNSRLEMKVIEVVRERNRLIFSATAAEEEKRKRRLQELNKGDIILGEVVNLVDFGIFVDLDGIDGLVHLSELEWKRVKHPSEIYSVGDEINVKVLDVDIDRQRVSLSRKALLPSPWEMPDELPEQGVCLEGRVVKIVNFGAFVELPIGIEGLVHTSQLGYTHLENPKDAVKRGEIVLVRVLEVDPIRRRISLSMRQVPRELQISWAIEHLEDDDLLGTEQESPVESTSEGQEKTTEIDAPDAASKSAESVDQDQDQTQDTQLDTPDDAPSDTPTEQLEDIDEPKSGDNASDAPESEADPVLPPDTEVSSSAVNDDGTESKEGNDTSDVDSSTELPEGE